MIFKIWSSCLKSNNFELLFFKKRDSPQNFYCSICSWFSDDSHKKHCPEAGSPLKKAPGAIEYTRKESVFLIKLVQLNLSISNDVNVRVQLAWSIFEPTLCYFQIKLYVPESLRKTQKKGWQNFIVEGLKVAEVGFKC